MKKIIPIVALYRLLKKNMPRQRAYDIFEIRNSYFNEVFNDFGITGRTDTISYHDFMISPGAKGDMDSDIKLIIHQTQNNRKIVETCRNLARDNNGTIHYKFIQHKVNLV